MDTAELKGLIAKHVGIERVPRTIKIIHDTTDFFKVDYDNVVIIEGIPYFIRNAEREGRFGIDDQPKFWVRRAVDLITGRMKILKMTFHERFTAHAGSLVYECVRSPEKEARILDAVRGHPNFMQGAGARDEAGNIIRIIEYIPGKTLADYALTLGTDHRDYFENHLPAMLDVYADLLHAIGFLHARKENHGDIRRDHVILDRDSGLFRWIDFDFTYWHSENPFGYDLFGLGNILAYIVGRGDVIVQDLKGHPEYSLLCADDMNIIFGNRVINLRKVYPYIPSALNRILLHFSHGSETFYDSTEQLADDLREARSRLGNLTASQKETPQ